MIQLFIPACKGSKTVMACNIIRIEGSSNYCRLYFDNAYPLTVAKVLHWFEDQLPDNFCRIHKTHIINRQFISTISPDNNTITLVNGEQLKISRRRKTMVRQILA